MRGIVIGGGEAVTQRVVRLDGNVIKIYRKHKITCVYARMMHIMYSLSPNIHVIYTLLLDSLSLFSYESPNINRTNSDANKDPHPRT